MSNYVTIREAIFQKIDTGKVKIASVYKTPVSTIESFPGVIIEPSGHKSEYETTKNRERIYSFDLSCYYAFNNEADQTISDLALDEVADELIAMFDESGSLATGGVTMVSPLVSEWGYFETDEGIYRYVRLTLDCRVIKEC